MFHLCVYFSPGSTIFLTTKSLYIFLEFTDELWSCINYDQLCDLERLAGSVPSCFYMLGKCSMPTYLSLRDMSTLRIMKHSIHIFKNVNDK